MEIIPQEREGARNRGIDLFRGLLVILVILGHFSELTDRHTFTYGWASASACPC